MSDDGDRCDWFGIDRQIARDAVRAVRGGDPEQPFNWTRSLCDPQTYVHQRRIFELARRGGANALQIEEESIALLERVITAPDRTSSTEDTIAKRFTKVELLLGANFERPLKLQRDRGARQYVLRNFICAACFSTTRRAGPFMRT